MMTQWFAHPVLAWALTWLTHSTLLLGAVWLFERLWPQSTPRLREFLWRVAILASLVSASAVAANFTSYTTQRIEIPQVQVLRGDADIDPLPVAAPQPAIDDSGAQVRIDLEDAAVVSVDRVQLFDALQPSPAWIFWAWGLIVAFLFLRLWHLLTCAVSQLGERTPLAPDHRAHLILERLVQRAGGGKSPRLTLSGSASGPVTLPGNEICLPRWALTSLSPSQLAGILAHELAHCLRRDPLMLLLAEVLRRLLFVQPLLTVAARRLAELAELAADERAVELTGDQQAVAESLAECAGRLRNAEPAWGVAMARNRSSFMQRIRRLLHPDRFTIGGPAWHTQLMTAVAALVFALALPGFVVAAKDSSSRSVSATRSVSTTIITDDDGGLRVIDVEIEEDGFSMAVQGMGEFRLNDEETDVAEMADGARLDIEENNETRRKIRFESVGGAIERTYWVDGDDVELDSDGRRWLAAVLPRLMRETGINVEERASRLHRQGGADRILEEIGLIEGEHTRRVYTTWLVRNDDLNDRQYDELLDLIGNIDGDYESRIVLTEIAEHEQLDGQRAARLLEIGAGIDSDYEMRALIEHLVTRSDVVGVATDLLIEVIASIDSDYEMRTAFGAVVADGGIAPEGLPKLISVSGREINSDYELRTLLQSLAGQVNTHPDAPLAYIGATLEIESDYERREAIVAFAEHADHDAEGWTEAIKAAATISGDYERAETLIRLGGRMPQTEENLQLYRLISETLGSHERERALSAIGLLGV